METVLLLMAYADMLQRVGMGQEATVRLQDGAEYVKVPDGMALPAGSRTKAALIERVYGEGQWHSADWLIGRGILTPLVDDVDNLNAEVTAMFPGDDVQLHQSADSAEGASNAHGGMPVEFLNRLCPSGL